MIRVSGMRAEEERERITVERSGRIRDEEAA
jgi:hypothetical protein